MQLSLMLFMPVLGAVIAWLIPDNRRRPLVLPLFAVIHLALLGWVLGDPPPASAGGWFLLDPIGVAHRRWLPMAACLAVGLIATIIAVIAWKPVYVATSTILMMICAGRSFGCVGRWP